MVKRSECVAAALLAGTLLLAAQGRATTFYVSAAGNDSNAGTSASPFQTINRGIATAGAGDTISVANGTYLGCSGGAAGYGNMVEINSAGSPAARITLAAQNRGGAVLDGQNICHTIIDFGTAAAYWNIQGFVVKNAFWSGITINAGGQHDILIKGNEVRNIGNRYNDNNYAITGIYVGIGNSNVTIDGNLIHDNGPTSTGPNDPAHDHQLYLHGSNINVINNVIYNGYNGPHINLGGAGYTYSGTIADNTFYGYSISSYYIDGAIWSNGNNGDNGIVPIIKNNIFYNVRTVAINGATLVSAGCAVQNNIVFNAPGTTAAGGAKLIAATPTGCTGSYNGNKVNVDPMLVSPPTDVHLKAGSPAISGALPVAMVTTDFAGVARPSIPDIGAYQAGAGGAAPPPTALALSGVGATGISATAATIGWTTNVSADGQVVYGLTASYGSATAVNAALATSHRFALSGLTSGTLYHYAVRSHDASGGLVSSPDSTFTTTAPTAPPGCAASVGAWQTLPLTAQTGTFTAQFDVTPGAAAIDGASGMSSGAPTAWSNLAAAIRFNNTGMIDARNGGAYAAAAPLPYVSGMTYHFRLVVNIPSHSYSAYVKQGANAEQLVGSNYAFRTEQVSVRTLDNLGVFTDAGTITTCNASAAAITATTLGAVSVSAIGQTVATIGWTTNNPADTQVQYGPTSAYGNTTPLSEAPTTAHSVSLGGLTAGTVYHYRVMSRDAAGALATSPDSTFTTAAAPTTAPVISAVASTGVTASAATINWTTDKPADSQVLYGPAPAHVTVIRAGSIYTLSSPLSSSLSAAHSVALSGLTASTLYHFVAKSSVSGTLTTSPDSTFTTPAATPGVGAPAGTTVTGTSGGSTPGGGILTACMTSAGTWQNAAVPSLTGTFTAEFDGTPGAAATDGVGGLSNGPATSFSSFGVAVRFNNAGKIDARNGGAYTAASSIAYKAGTAYRFRLVVNLTAHSYSAYVKQGANAEALIGSNYAFRTEQRAVLALNNLGAFADGGSIMVCNGTIHP